MKFFISKGDGGIVARARVEAKGGTVGDFIETVRPGGTLFGLPYADLKAALPVGFVEIGDKDGSEPESRHA